WLDEESAALTKIKSAQEKLESLSHTADALYEKILPKARKVIAPTDPRHIMEHCRENYNTASDCEELHQRFGKQGERMAWLNTRCYSEAYDTAARQLQAAQEALENNHKQVENGRVLDHRALYNRDNDLASGTTWRGEPVFHYNSCMTLVEDEKRRVAEE